MSLRIFIFVCFITTLSLKNAISQATTDFDNFLEKYIESLEENDEIDINEIREFYIFRHENPINLNTCDREDLEELNLLSEQQINSFFEYKSNLGNLISIYELQAIPLFDLNTVELLSYLVNIGGAEGDYHKSLISMISESKREWIMKAKTTLEDKAGYLADEGETPKYAGDPMTYYTRLKIKFENRLDIGIIAEKDPGELFFRGYNKNGFDYYSAHFFIYKPFSWLKELNIGDYTVSLGQGLIMSNDYGRGKSSLVNHIKKNSSKVIRPYNSVNENLYQRGIGATFNILKNTELTLFGSYKKIDASLQYDEIDYEDDEVYASSLQISGFHRTETEIEGRKGIDQLSLGYRLNYKFRAGYIGANVYNVNLSRPLQRDQRLYSQFQFSGNKLLNTSLDYSYLFRNILLFGELARSNNNAYAFISGLQFFPSSKFDVSLLYRNYSKEYQSLNSNSFGETVGTNNEEGIYLGLNYNISPRWSLSIYNDIWKFPWLKYSISQPSTGNEIFGILRYTIRHKFIFYTQFKNESKPHDISNSGLNINPSELGIKKRLRFHFDYTLQKSWSFRNRIEFADYRLSDNHSRGFMIYQDVIFNPVNLPIDISMRYAFFDTDDYNSGIYAYENDLVGESYIPVYSGKGFRSYINFKYRVNNNLKLEIRLGRWYYPDEKSIGSSNELIQGNKKTDLKVQLRMGL